MTDRLTCFAKEYYTPSNAEAETRFSKFMARFNIASSNVRQFQFLSGIYREHDWTGDGPVPRSTRAKWHKRLASEIESYLDALDESARQALGRLIQNPAPTNRFFVFNSLNCKSAGGIRWKAIPGRTIQHQGQSGNQLVNIMAAVECRETDGAARLPNQAMRWA